MIYLSLATIIGLCAAMIYAAWALTRASREYRERLAECAKLRRNLSDLLADEVSLRRELRAIRAERAAGLRQTPTPACGNTPPAPAPPASR